MRGKVACADQTIQPDGITPAWAGKSSPAAAGRGHCQDYPRMGGEKFTYILTLQSSGGSPPHGRGKAGHPAVHVLLERITPAWAGKSLFCFATAVPIQDHPRMGGEKIGYRYTRKSQMGSPPHGRGKDRRSADHSFAGGITPAWAGKSTRHQARGRRAQDHPRMGGEKSMLAFPYLRL